MGRRHRGRAPPPPPPGGGGLPGFTGGSLGGRLPVSPGSHLPFPFKSMNVFGQMEANRALSFGPKLNSELLGKLVEEVEKPFETEEVFRLSS